MDVGPPFIQQLKGIGWETIEGSVEVPAVTGRDGRMIRRPQ